MLGLADVGKTYLEVLREDPRFDLIAVGDTESDVLQSFPESATVRGYDDFRSLIVESARRGLDALIVTLEPFQTIEYLPLAEKYNIAVYHKPPFARNTEEARRLIDPFSEKNLPFVVAQLWPVEPKCARWGLWDELLGHLYSGSTHLQTTNSPSGWRGDQLRAGGGVLLNGAYEQIHFLIRRFGIPQTVFAHCCKANPAGETRNYDTEDAATVVFDFGHDCSAGVTAWRGAAKNVTQLSVTGTTGMINIRQNNIELTTFATSTTRKTRFDLNSSIASELGAFATVCMGDVCTSLSRAEQHLTTLAAIEAAYLSAKTGAPESPQQFINV